MPVTPFSTKDCFLKKLRNTKFINDKRLLARFKICDNLSISIAALAAPSFNCRPFVKVVKVSLAKLGVSNTIDAAGAPGPVDSQDL